MKMRQIVEKRIDSASSFRAAKYKEVENRIKQHTQLMKEKRKKLRGLPKEDMEKANQDLETVGLHLENKSKMLTL